MQKISPPAVPGENAVRSFFTTSLSILGIDHWRLVPSVAFFGMVVYSNSAHDDWGNIALIFSMRMRHPRIRLVVVDVGVASTAPQNEIGFRNFVTNTYARAYAEPAHGQHMSLKHTRVCVYPNMHTCIVNKYIYIYTHMRTDSLAQ